MILYTGAWLYGVHIMCAKMAAVSHGTMHVTTKQHVSTPLWWILNNALFYFYF